MKRKKIINDPVYGFITIPFETVQRIIDHPWFQRLTRIRQLGLTSLVYPGALHTRFHHALGAMYLMTTAIETLRSKGHEITEEEAEAATIAILLHDIGHGPFSHALENLLVHVDHEYLSDLFMQRLNQEFQGKLTEAIRIFNDEHPKRFLHQLVSSQLDVDRLDYLNRDSFFTGVSEGVISSERIIKMLEVAGGNLVVEEKGLYSVEKFIIARRLMYWQVYLHKTTLAAEHMLISIIKRARELCQNGEPVFGSGPLLDFLSNDYGEKDFQSRPELLEQFASLDDFDVLSAVKAWANHSDKTLSLLCKSLIDRRLFKISITKTPPEQQQIESIKQQVSAHFGVDISLADYLVLTGKVWNSAYKVNENNIHILFKDGRLTDIAEASDNLNISSLSSTVTKYFLASPYLGS
ncbi:MAG: HD domain-containing protein [Arcticibacter sp.]